MVSFVLLGWDVSTLSEISVWICSLLLLKSSLNPRLCCRHPTCLVSPHPAARPHAVRRLCQQEKRSTLGERVVSFLPGDGSDGEQSCLFVWARLGQNHVSIQQIGQTTSPFHHNIHDNCARLDWRTVYRCIGSYLFSFWSTDFIYPHSSYLYHLPVLTSAWK